MIFLLNSGRNIPEGEKMSTTAPASAETSDEEFTTMLTTCIIFSVIYVIFMPLFLYRRNREPIKSRGWQLSAVQMTISFMDIIYRTVVRFGNNCAFEQVRSLTLLGLWVSPYIIRGFLLW